MTRNINLLFIQCTIICSCSSAVCLCKVLVFKVNMSCYRPPLSKTRCRIFLDIRYRISFWRENKKKHSIAYFKNFGWSIKQIFNSKNRISKLFSLAFDDIRLSFASSNIIKARLNNFRYPIFLVEYLLINLYNSKIYLQHLTFCLELTIHPCKLCCMILSRYSTRKIGYQK